uniref:Uncharacterized protein n=1 Tax=Capra hircus TaxID=9925 RepID=A0A8C2NZT8_CAPHI
MISSFFFFKSRAAIVWKPGGSFSIEEVEVAPPKAKEVRIKHVTNSSFVWATFWIFLK